MQQVTCSVYPDYSTRVGVAVAVVLVVVAIVCVVVESYTSHRCVHVCQGRACLPCS